MPTRRPNLRDRVRKAAYEMFEQGGIRHVTVEAIAEAASTTKMGVYRQFGSKDDLVASWLANTIDTYRSMLDATEPADSDKARDQLRKFAKAIAERLPDVAKRGCPFINTIAEIGNPEDPLVSMIMAHKRRQAERIEHLCKRAGFLEPSIAASQISLLLEGAQVTAQNGSIDGIQDLLLTMIDSILMATD